MAEQEIVTVHIEAKEKDDFLFYYLVPDDLAFDPKLILTVWMGAIRSDADLAARCNKLVQDHVDRVFGTTGTHGGWETVPAKKDS